MINALLLDRKRTLELAAADGHNVLMIGSRGAGEETTGEKTREKKNRWNVKHIWPEVGSILEADYNGTHYEAEVVPMENVKSGKALKMLTGPAAGEVRKSMSRAILDVTEKQREEKNLGRSGVANGWDFWSVKKEDSE